MSHDMKDWLRFLTSREMLGLFAIYLIMGIGFGLVQKDIHVAIFIPAFMLLIMVAITFIMLLLLNRKS